MWPPLIVIFTSLLAVAYVVVVVYTWCLEERPAASTGRPVAELEAEARVPLATLVAEAERRAIAQFSPLQSDPHTARVVPLPGPAAAATSPSARSLRREVWGRMKEMIDAATAARTGFSGGQADAWDSLDATLNDLDARIMAVCRIMEREDDR